MKKYFYFALLAALFTSCDNDEDVTPFFELSCLGNASTPLNNPSCETFPLNPQICESVYVGDFVLEEESRSYLAQFCREINSTETYVNANGEELPMEVYIKSFIKTSSLRNTFIPCENDSTKYIGACIDLELAFMKMRSPDSTLDITLQLSTKLSNNNPLEPRVADYVEITRAIGANTFVQELSVIINPRNIGFDQSPTQENLGTINLLGESFDEVISVDISAFPDPKPFKYYYNKRYGLIAFEDEDGVLWRIDL